MKIGELARRTGLSTHTIRYYEKIGLLPYADRDNGHQRDYDASILLWVEFLGNLKATGMPIAQMLAYAKLRHIGDQTIHERRLILEAHRQKVETHIQILHENLALLNRKINAYQKMEKEMDATSAKDIDWEKRFQNLVKPQP